MNASSIVQNLDRFTCFQWTDCKTSIVECLGYQVVKGVILLGTGYSADSEQLVIETPQSGIRGSLEVYLVNLS